MILCILFISLCLMCVYFSWMSRAYAKDELEIYETQLEATLSKQKQCEEVITSNETNLKWLRAMIAAFNIDKTNAARQLDLARKAANTKDFPQAMMHLRKALNWYDAYHQRLKTIYGLEKGNIPPIPVIE
jgi:hypothetical protein